MGSRLINGARIDESYLNENLDEARSYAWERGNMCDGNHAHCIICGIAIHLGEQAFFCPDPVVWLCCSRQIEFNL